MRPCQPASGRALDVRAAPAAVLSAIRTSRVVSTHAWLAAGLAPVQPDSHVCMQGIYYVPDAPRWHDNGWAGQFVLAYMRLVRSGVVRAQRKRSAQWREVQAARHRRDANVTSAQEHDARVARWAQQRQQQQEAQRGAPNARASAQPPAPPPAQPHSLPHGDAVAPREHSGNSRSAAAAAHSVALTPIHAGGSDADINFDCDDNDAALPNHPNPPRRTRRTDGVLCLTLRARDSMRAQFGGGGTRLADARRARGDG